MFTSLAIWFENLKINVYLSFHGNEILFSPAEARNLILSKHDKYLIQKPQSYATTKK